MYQKATRCTQVTEAVRWTIRQPVEEVVPNTFFNPIFVRAWTLQGETVSSQYRCVLGHCQMYWSGLAVAVCWLFPIYCHQLAIDDVQGIYWYIDDVLGIYWWWYIETGQEVLVFSDASSKDPVVMHSLWVFPFSHSFVVYIVSVCPILNFRIKSLFEK